MLLTKFNNLVILKTTELNNQMIVDGIQDVGQCGFAEARIFFGRNKSTKELLVSCDVAIDSQEKYCGKSYYIIQSKSEYSPRLRNQTRAYAIKCEEIILNAAIEVFELDKFETRIQSWID